jgi:adenylate cyclase
VVFYALDTSRRTELELRRERARADAMVATVLPDSISARLRAQPERRIADRIDQASILFADLEGFTIAAHSEPAEIVVAYLDDLVRAFDQMREPHGVEKIKMIGDAYMAAGGLRGEGPAGAVAMGKLALAMLAFQESRPPLGTRRLRLRIGIHTGPAIAGVIGDTRVAYDIWGDAVNTASRMESHGIAGRIHVSDAFRRAAGDAFEFEERGETEVRGLGRVRTHFLLRER